MTGASSTISADEVRVGDRIRARDIELTVTRIDAEFFGSLLAFVEDSDERWVKVALPADADVSRA